jgi:hypothetical protein
LIVTLSARTLQRMVRRGHQRCDLRQRSVATRRAALIMQTGVDALLHDCVRELAAYPFDQAT